jgi:hypothetical protein
MKMFLPLTIGLILVAVLFAIERLADKKGLGKLVSMIRTGLILGIIAGYTNYFILHQR